MSASGKAPRRFFTKSATVVHSAAAREQAEKLFKDDLWVATRTGDVEGVRRCLSARAASMKVSVAEALQQEVGSEGETLLHIALLFYGPSKTEEEFAANSHKRVAEYLTEVWPDIIVACYSLDPWLDGKASDYQGENALHIAIAKGCLFLVRWLMERAPSPEHKWWLLHAQATGHFFQEGGNAYFGEWPISFAVSLNHGDIVAYLCMNFKDMVRL